MPGWHEKTRELQKTGRLRVVGIVQEQHPDRTRLFQTWKELDWPVLVDSLNTLGVRAVPLTYLVDEQGIVRSTRPDEKELHRFLETSYENPDRSPPRASSPDLELLRREAKAKESPEASTRLADALFHGGDPASLDEAIATWREAIALEDDPAVRFRLGVALRRRYESESAHPGDFQGAVTEWTNALAARPDQYIWRRRIEQYGPRLEKPYAFYDWVETARREIRQRGAEPPALHVEPRGTELAGRVRELASSATVEDPDPRDSVPRDAATTLERRPLVRSEVAIAPARVEPGKALRIHVELVPDLEQKVHWSNEAAETLLFLRPPTGVELDRTLLTVPNASTETSVETRRFEIEARLSKDVTATDGVVRVPAFVLYSVCEDVHGVCRFLRQDLELVIPLR